MRVAIYTRVSTDEQAKDDKLSLSDQEQRCRAWCAENGHTVVRVYRDELSGGTKPRNRPGLRDALNAAAAGEYDILLSKRVDRLTRNIDHIGQLVGELEECSIILAFAEESFEDTPIGKLVKYISAWRGEQERAVLRDRARVGRKGRALAGKHNCGTPPYGYSRRVIATRNTGSDREAPVYGDLQVDEYEAAQVRRMFDLYVREGLSLRQLAFGLNAEHVPLKRRGQKGWTGQQVRRILIGEVYTGRGYHNTKHSTGKRGVYEMNPREEWIEIAYPRIVDDETFAQARARVTENRAWRRAPAGDHHLLQGIAKCGECGHAILCMNSGGRERARRAYQCNGQIQRGYECRKPAWIRADTIEAPVWELIERACQNPDLWVAASAAHGKKERAAHGDVEALREDVRRRLQRAQDGRARLLQLVANGVLPADDRDLVIQLKDCDDRVDACMHELKRLEQRATDHETDALQRDAAERLVREVGPRLGRMNFEQRRALLRDLVRIVWVGGDGTITVEAALPYLNAARVVTEPTLKLAKLIGVRP